MKFNLFSNNKQDDDGQFDDGFASLLEKIRKYFGKKECNLIIEAYNYAKKCHANQFRKSGEPYIIHPVAVAEILTDLYMDYETICAALLHDTVEDCDVGVDDIASKFNENIANLVDGVTKITQIEVESLSESQANNLRKMLVAMSKDIRVIVIKLADRLNNMRTLISLPEDRRLFKAKETMEVYAPLAHRLGINSIRWELEDLAFFYLEPLHYQRVLKMVNETREKRQEYLDEVLDLLTAEIDKLDCDAEIYGRPKHLYSIYKKMASQGKGFSQIYDLTGMRIIVKSIPECYMCLGAVHNLWSPMPGRFKDYIAMPKYNMYQSLHTTVIGPAGRPLEIQIRTVEMHRYNEFGIAAHWRYKEGKAKDKATAEFDQKLSWLSEMLDWQKDTQDSKEFLDEFRDDLFNSEVYVFTPKGEVKALRANATALDFAYSIHSEVGNHCVGAKVNGSIVPLTYQLKTGDRVEILTLSSASPSKDWLNFVHTPTARNKIRNYFSKSNRNEDIEAGKNLLTQQLKELKIDFDFKKNQNVLDAVTTQLSFVNSDDLFANIGSKKISAYHTAKRIERTIVAANKDEKISNQEFLYNSHLSLSSGKTVSSANRPNKTYSQNGIAVKGLDDALVYLAQCCNPIFGDEIVGFITRGKGVSVHRANCPNVSDLKQKNPGRQIDVSWAQHSIDSFKAKIYIEAVDRMNLLYDISQFLSRQGLNIVSCELYTNKDNTCDITVVIEVSDIERLEQILRELLTVDGVFSARRLTSN